MPSRRSGGDLVLFSSGDPQPLVNWLCETYGLATILQAVAQVRPGGAQQQEAPARRGRKRRGRKPGPKKGSKRRGRPPGSKNKASGGRRGRPPGGSKKQDESNAGGKG